MLVWELWRSGVLELTNTLRATNATRNSTFAGSPKMRYPFRA
jgi:hypothetical protein